MKNLTLKKSKRRPRILSGHQWAYRSELQGLDDIEAGEIVDLKDYRGQFIGRGYGNPLSEISFRLLSFEKESIDVAFFEKRLSQSFELRKRHGLLEQSCRLVFSEADLLPGFIVDWYAPVAVLSITTAGADRLKNIFLEALTKLLLVTIHKSQATIFERSDNPARLKEGLEIISQTLTGNLPEKVFGNFDGLNVEVDYQKGQKTGAFLDARNMRRHLKENSQGQNVLDCFSHIGLFGRYAHSGGASHVTFVETDSEPCSLIKTDLPQSEVISENVFDVLRDLAKQKRTFDRIVLDPPPFAKDARSVEGALRGYKDINLRAMKLLNPGGLLYTSSCSYHVDGQLFAAAVNEAAIDAGTTLRVVENFIAAPDHPVLLSVPETSYFKGMCLEKI